jgi:hypothetical protein
MAIPASATVEHIKISQSPPSVTLRSGPANDLPVKMRRMSSSQYVNGRASEID